MKFFSRFTRPSATGWAWVFPSAAPSSRRMAVTYGQRTTRIIPARHFPLRCRWKKVSSDEERVRCGQWRVASEIWQVASVRKIWCQVRVSVFRKAALGGKDEELYGRRRPGSLSEALSAPH